MSSADTEKCGVFPKRKSQKMSVSQLASLRDTNLANQPKSDAQKVSEKRIQRVPEPIKAVKIVKNPEATTNLSQDISTMNSQWLKTKQLIEDLDNTLDKSPFLQQQTGMNAEKFGDIKSVRASNESIETDSDYSLALESPDYQIDLSTNLMKEIQTLSDKLNAEETKRILKLIGEVNEKFDATERMYKNKIKMMKVAQNNSFGELFVEKNDQITKLQVELVELKVSLNEVPKLGDELLRTKNNLAQFKRAVKKYNEENNVLKHKLNDAYAYIDGLEKKKISLEHLSINGDTIKKHFEAIRETLQFNGNLIKTIYAKKRFRLTD